MYAKGSRAQAYRCAVPGCCWATEPRVFMCLSHWRMVPMDMKSDIQNAYRSTGENTPTRDALLRCDAYVLAADAATRFVSEREGRGPAESLRGLNKRPKQASLPLAA